MINTTRARCRGQEPAQPSWLEQHMQLQPSPLLTRSRPTHTSMLHKLVHIYSSRCTLYKGTHYILRYSTSLLQLNWLLHPVLISNSTHARHSLYNLYFIIILRIYNECIVPFNEHICACSTLCIKKLISSKMNEGKAALCSISIILYIAMMHVPNSPISILLYNNIIIIILRLYS